MPQAVDLSQKLSTFDEAFQPRTVSLFNGHDVMVAKLRGDYHWHVHPDTDDFFLVLAGSLEIDLEDGSIVKLSQGQM
jgi:mannose-6-phosphate isomerase-like protein (cupin superfamily)